MTTPLPYRWKALRLARGWSQAKVLHLMTVTAADLGVTIPTRPTLKTMLSRWENGANTSQFYTELLCRVFALPSPYGNDADMRRERRHNSRVYTRIFGPGYGWTTRTPIQPGTYLQAGAR